MRLWTMQLWLLLRRIDLPAYVILFETITFLSRRTSHHFCVTDELASDVIIVSWLTVMNTFNSQKNAETEIDRRRDTHTTL